MIYVILAIPALLLIIAILIMYILHQRSKYSTLRSIYTNGEGAGGLGEHASIAEWRRLANASLNASRERRKNGDKAHG